MVTFLSQAMCMSCFEDRQSIHPLVPEQWTMSTAWVWGWEDAGGCESERRQGDVGMEGELQGLREQLPLLAPSHSLVCLWALTSWGRYLSTDLHLVSDHLLEIQTTPSPTLGSHSHPVGQYEEMGSLMSIRSLRLIARQVPRVKQQLAWSSSLTLVFVDKRTFCKGKHGRGQMQP